MCIRDRSITYLDNNYDYEISEKPIESLKNLIGNSKFDKGEIEVPYPILVGYLGYPMIQYMEKIDLRNADNINIPDSVLIRPKIVTVFDNIKDSITVMTVVYPYKDKDEENAYENAQEILKIKVNQLKESLVQTKKNQIQSDLNFVSNLSLIHISEPTRPY